MLLGLLEEMLSKLGVLSGYISGLGLFLIEIIKRLAAWFATSYIRIMIRLKKP